MADGIGPNGPFTVRPWTLDLTEPILVETTLPPPSYGPTHSPWSEYAEMFWLPAVGPTTYLLGRRLVLIARDTPGPVPVVPSEVGELIGAPGTGHSAPLGRAFGRLLSFRLADFHEAEHRLVVLAQWPVVWPRVRTHWTGALALAARVAHGVDR